MRDYTQYCFRYVRERGASLSVRHALLALLSSGSKYGLQLLGEFEARTGEVWPLNVGQVYSTLRRLERDGEVESEDEDGPQKRYRITESGLSELAAWLRPPPPGTGPPRDELVIKVLVAVGVPGVDVHNVLQSHRRWILEEMQSFTRLKEDAAATELGLLLVADAEIFRLDALAHWLDAVDGRLRSLGDAPIELAPVAASLRAGRRRSGAHR